jgi:hypothetical protein
MWKQLSTAYQSMYLDEAMKYTHAVIDPDGNVLGFTSNQLLHEYISLLHQDTYFDRQLKVVSTF